MANWTSKTDTLPNDIQNALASLRGHLGEDGYQVLADIVVWAHVWQDSVNGVKREDDAAINVAMLPFFGSFGMPDTWTILQPQITPLLMQTAVNWVVARQAGASFYLPQIIIHQISIQIATVLHGVTKGAEVTNVVDAIHIANGEG